MTYALARRVAVPLWLAGAAALLAVMPVLALLARALGAATRRPEPVALVRLLYVYVTGELAMLSAPARSHQERMRQLERFLDDLVRGAMSDLQLQVSLDAEPAADAALRDRERSVLAFCRHAGLGDSVLLIHLLLARYGRAPGIVMKEILTLDPVVGIVARHLPAALIDGGVEDPDEIRDVARSLDGHSAMVLFPEGGNYTPRRRAKAIDWLQRNEHPRRAARYRELRHVMAPRPVGALAALEGAGGADVVFISHAGLGHRWLPRDRTIRLRLWHVPAADVPGEEDARVAWLDDWWERVDAWVAAQEAR